MITDNPDEHSAGEEASDKGKPGAPGGSGPLVVYYTRSPAGIFFVVFLVVIAIVVGGFFFVMHLFVNLNTPPPQPRANRDYAQSSWVEIEDIYHDISTQIDAHIQETYHREDVGNYSSNSPKETTSSCEGGRRVYYRVGTYEKIKVNQLNDLVEYVSTVVEPYGYQNREVRSTTYNGYSIYIQHHDERDSVHIHQGTGRFSVSFRSPCYAHADDN